MGIPLAHLQAAIAFHLHRRRKETMGYFHADRDPESPGERFAAKMMGALDKALGESIAAQHGGIYKDGAIWLPPTIADDCELTIELGDDDED